MARTAYLSDQLREIIETRGTAYGIGRAAGVDPGQIQRFLNGERGLTLATLDKIGESLGLWVKAPVRPAKGRKAAPAKRTPAKAKATTPGDGDA